MAYRLRDPGALRCKKTSACRTDALFRTSATYSLKKADAVSSLSSPSEVLRITR